MTKRVMIVEDEALVALTLEDLLMEAGYLVCGIADRPADALDLARALEPALAPELAIVDVRLADGGDGIVLAELLAAEMPIRILFATGNPAEVRARATAGHGCLCKPFGGETLLAALEAVQFGSTGEIPGFFHLPLGLGR